MISLELYIFWGSRKPSAQPVCEEQKQDSFLTSTKAFFLLSTWKQMITLWHLHSVQNHHTQQEEKARSAGQVILWDISWILSACVAHVRRSVWPEHRCGARDGDFNIAHTNNGAPTHLKCFRKVITTGLPFHITTSSQYLGWLSLNNNNCGGSQEKHCNLHRELSRDWNGERNYTFSHICLALWFQLTQEAKCSTSVTREFTQV